MYKGIIPATMYVSMRYTELLQLADAVTGLAYNVYNANGIWDPNFSATGHQPMGYDQWSTLYKTYRVKKCTIKAECANNQSTVPCLFIIAPSETTALLANAGEQPGAVSCLVSQDTSGPNIRKLGPVTMDMSKFDGDIGAKYMEDMELSLEQINEPEVFSCSGSKWRRCFICGLHSLCRVRLLVELSERVPLAGS